MRERVREREGGGRRRETKEDQLLFSKGEDGRKGEREETYGEYGSNDERMILFQSDFVSTLERSVQFFLFVGLRSL